MPNGREYYLYAISKDDILGYSVAMYIVYSNSNNIEKEMVDVGCDEIRGTVNSANIPQAVRDRAAQDYPNLAPSGFTVSSGTWWIIAAGAVVIVGGVVAIIVANKKKKKPALASGAEITDDTEKPEE